VDSLLLAAEVAVRLEAEPNLAQAGMALMVLR
jgi:hypothetical protein